MEPLSAKALASSKEKLWKFSSTLGNEMLEECIQGPLGKSGKLSGESGPWQTVVAACGSNAFHQTGLDPLDLMSSTLKPVDLPTTRTSKSAPYIEQISCGSNISAAVVSEDSEESNSCYLWGSGLPGSALRVPTRVTAIRGQVAMVSCGSSHVAAVTASGQAYTWGAGDSGQLGHGIRQPSQATPKFVEALQPLVVVGVSCGGFHTVFIAASQGEVTSLTLLKEPPRVSMPSSAASTTGDRLSSLSRLEREEGLVAESTRKCGSVYVCGQGKAGQLGLGAAVQRILTPTVIPLFEQNNLQVAQVSCGLHHTLFIAAPKVRSSYACTCTTYSTGWGEHGRLGVGDEEMRCEPTPVQFDFPFHVTEIAAGEQHSLVVGRDGSGYGFGCNEMGQLGIGSPATTEMSLLPTKIPLPEGMAIRSIGAGGRHSSCITFCGKILCWGWGEEGQLGNGSERDSALPRPAKIPRIRGEMGKPISVKLGMSHTLVIFRNMKLPLSPVKKSREPDSPGERFFATEIIEADMEVPIDLPPVPKTESKPSVLVEETEESMFLDDVDEGRKDEIAAEEAPHVAHVATLADNEEDAPKEELSEPDEESTEAPRIVETGKDCSLKELWSLREERMLLYEQQKQDEFPPENLEMAQNEDYVEVEEGNEDGSDEEVEDIIEPHVSPVRQQLANAALSIETFQEELNIPEELLAPNNNNNNNEGSSAGLGSINNNKINIYYREGQNTENCLVANSAKRAEMRRQKKQDNPPK